ncbi:MAG: hypothetical protein AAFU58_11140, partial [Pseudomonadota bacterium]
GGTRVHGRIKIGLNVHSPRIGPWQRLVSIVPEKTTAFRMTRQSLAIGLPIFARQVKCYVIKQRGITITMASANESFHP